MLNKKFWNELYAILLEIEDKAYWSSNGYSLDKKSFLEIKKRLEKTIDKK